MKKNLPVIGAGVLVGLVAILLGYLGNPGNMAFCIACFVRDTAGALGMHRAEAVQYIRPEIIGLVLGAFVISLLKKDFAPKGGSSPVTRFILGVCVMVGALIFLGCPLRLVLRIAGGDVNAMIGIVGFVGGILTGIAFFNRGFSLKRNYDQTKIEAVGMPAINVVLLILLIAAPAFIFFSESGPGSMRAPWWIALIGALIVGIAAERTRLCFIGGIRDAVMLKDFHMMFPFIAILLTVFIGNLITGNLNFGLADQPIAHSEWIWNIAGLYLVGFGSMLLGGCPLRQLVLAGSGNSDSGVTVLGFLVGTAIVHNFNLASSGAGTTPNGRIAFVICVLIVLVIAFLNTKGALKQEVSA